jgi:hypothetical protein
MLKKNISINSALGLISLSIVFFFVFAMSSRAKGNDTVINAVSRVDRSRISVGERLIHTTTIISDTDIVIYPIKAEAFLGRFKVRDSTVTVEKRFGRYHAMLRCVLISYDTGMQVIPGLEIRYIIDGVNKGTARSNAINVYVESVFETSRIGADIRPIEPPVGVKFAYTFHIILGIAIALLLTYLAVIFTRLVQNAIKKKKDRPVHALFLYRSLAQGMGCFSAGPGPDKDNFITMAGLVKEYIEAIYPLGAGRLTVEEFLRRIKRYDYIYNRYAEGLSFMLRTSDLVKFANYTPQKVDYERAEAFIKDIIKNTTPYQTRE